MKNDTDRAAINRANAQHSTGPKTEAGKQRSSLNALRHGLTGHTVILPTDDLAAYHRHTKKFVDEFQPKGAAEEQLLQMLSDTAWRLNRIPALEANLFTLAVIERADSINAADEPVRAALAIAQAFNENSGVFANLSILDQRLSRKFEKTLSQLQEIQAQRQKKETEALQEAATLLELHKKERTPFQPTESGFDFSTAQIERHMHLRDRRAKAKIYESEHRHKRTMAA